MSQDGRAGVGSAGNVHVTGLRFSQQHHLAFSPAEWTRHLGRSLRNKALNYWTMFSSGKKKGNVSADRFI